MGSCPNSESHRKESHTLKRIVGISAAALLLSSGLCNGDSLVITYRSGKTQTVVLDEPSQGISSWQFVNGAVSPKPLNDPPYEKNEETAPQMKAPPVKEQTGSPGNNPGKKSDVKIKWNAKPLSD